VDRDWLSLLAREMPRYEPNLNQQYISNILATYGWFGIKEPKMVEVMVRASRALAARGVGGRC
jgi:hypothetical protein